MENEPNIISYNGEKRSLISFVIHPDNEPAVIDTEMLISNILAIGPADEERRLFIEEGVNLGEAKELRLEFKHILRIGHLWMLTSLTKLTLTHNLIEKIENLEKLVNLSELDLSFNKIEKIENLDTLVNLEAFTLFNNKIKKLENMCNLKKLFIFSIGDNLIEDYKEVAYLRRFHKLRSLSFKGNPCGDNPLAYPFIASVLGQIKYLDYKFVDEKLRKIGETEFRGLLRVFDENDEKEEQERIKKEEYDNRVKFYAMSFVEYLSGPELFNTMFENDAEGSILLSFGGELLPCFDLYRVEYTERMDRLVEFAQKAYNDRQNEIKLFKNVVDNALMKSVEESKDVVADYEKKKKSLMAQLTELTQKFTSKQITLEEIEPSIVKVAEDFNDLLYDVWRTLMMLETNLFEQCEEARIQFAVNITEKINKLQEEARNAFVAWREHEGFWSVRQLETLSKYLGDKIMLIDASPALVAAMMDGDQLMNLIAGSSDNHLRFIDAREDVLTTRSNEWRDEIVEGATNDEINRNRSRILEINFYIDNQRLEWTDLQMTLNEPAHISFFGDEFSIFDINQANSFEEK